jgi:hypothetical protein
MQVFMGHTLTPRLAPPQQRGESPAWLPSLVKEGLGVVVIKNQAELYTGLTRRVSDSRHLPTLRSAQGRL